MATETMGLRGYDCNLEGTRGRIDEIGGVIDDIDDAIDEVALVIDTIQDVEEEADLFAKDVRGLRTAVSLLSKTAGLSTVGRIADDVLERIQEVAEKIEEEANKLAKRVNESSLATSVETAQDRLETARDRLDDVDELVVEQQDATQQVLDAIDNINANDPTGLVAAPALAAANEAAEVPNGLVGAVNQAYDDAKMLVDDLVVEIPIGTLRPVLNVARQFQQIDEAIAFLRGPLREVTNLLKPVEGLLDAVDFVFDVTIGPLVDIIQGELGIDTLIRAAEDRIDDFLPEIDVFDGLLAEIDALVGPIVDIDTLTAEDWLGQVESDLLGTIGDASETSLGIGTPGDDNLLAAFANPILYGGPGDDLLEAVQIFEGGEEVISNAILLAGEGEDIIRGAVGSGVDSLRFRGSLIEYSFTQAIEGGPIAFDHVNPLNRLINDGTELVEEIEEFVFTDFTLTLTELTTSVRNASEGGRNVRDIIFADATPITVDAGGGDDIVLGSPGDDTILGGDGEDDIAGNGGEDSIDGGDGTDTWRFAADNSGGGNDITVLLDEGTVEIGSLDTSLIGIENVLIEDNRETFLFGDPGPNALSGNIERDVIDGDAGDDVLSGGAQTDVLIGGPGADQIDGGPGGDWLYTADAAIAGISNFYDGGEGDDLLSYSADPIRAHLRSSPVNILQALLDRATVGRPDSGPIRTLGETGEIERLSADRASVITTDLTKDVERVVGSPFADLLFGGPAFQALNGGAGDDTIDAGTASGDIDGGEGDDLIIAGTNGASYAGGGGVDTLDLSRNPDVRWSVTTDGAIGSDIRAFTALDPEELAELSEQEFNARPALGSGNVEFFDRYLGSPNDDVFDLQVRESGVVTVFGGAGNDNLFGDSPFSGPARYDLRGEEGDDILRLIGDGDADGGAGNDLLRLDIGASSTGIAEGGADDDTIELRSGQWTIDGGPGFDRLIASDNPFGGFDLDLFAGDLQQAAPIGVQGAFFSNTTVTGIEEVVGSNEDADILRGGMAGDRLIGAFGNDVLEGISTINAAPGTASGQDALYGGRGSDTLLGHDDDDLLHGGGGIDSLDGGPGIDTASWSFSSPGASGAFEADEIGFVTADVAAGTAEFVLAGGGAIAGETLANIENLLGGGLADTLRGDDGDNVLSGGAGGDLLEGRGGDDSFAIEGDDTAIGGAGDDLFIVSAGNAVIVGGDDPGAIDTLDFGNLDGEVVFSTGPGGGSQYAATLAVEVPVWREGGGSEPRDAGGGVFLTPRDVFETDPTQINSLDDFARVVPEGPEFDIELATEMQSFTGTYEGIEQIVGGRAAGTVQLSGAQETFRGDLGAFNAISFAASGSGIAYDLASGVTNSALAQGDVLENINGIVGSELGDALALSNVPNRADGLGGPDLIQGRGGDDTVTGGLGDDTIDGGPGTDTARFIGQALDSAREISPGMVRVSTLEGTDTLTGVERGAFDDGVLLFDLDGPDRDFTYRLYDASFARIPDEGGLVFWVGRSNAGAITREGLANAFTSSDEFALRYGENPTDEEFITALYQNALRREPDQDGLDFWTREFDSGLVDRLDMLIAFADSVENIERNEPNLEAGVFVL